jgi:hypothetical protein|tara:strand:+ start:5175 stop:5354 length:180 start_codon:yes stop_codon:yes gene_type:complete
MAEYDGGTPEEGQAATDLKAQAKAATGNISSAVNSVANTQIAAVSNAGKAKVKGILGST